MATNFPTGLDSFTNPVSANPLNAPPHASQHANINDAMAAVQAKLGVNNSLDPTCIDYLVAALTTALNNLANGVLLKANNLNDVASVPTSRTNLGLGTSDSPEFAAINLGATSDTTLSRPSAGNLAVEGKTVYRADGTDVAVADGGTGLSTYSQGDLLVGNESNGLQVLSIPSIAPNGKTLIVNTDVPVGLGYVYSSVPVGTIAMYGGSSAPAGWVICDGSAVARSDYSQLFTAIGTTYGAGNGSTTFNVPDLRGRAPIGSGTGSGLTARTLGSTGGSESVTLSAAQIPAHSHPSGGGGNFVVSNAGGGAALAGGTGYQQEANTGNNTGGGGSHTNMQPWQAVNFIIYANV